ncbi:hypothetical protein BD560DRAFT_184183 [Blakeslea trispora]|nr:hypothetical protein BD560DRAFT_184183 [Blakeslea trispora]
MTFIGEIGKKKRVQKLYSNTLIELKSFVAGGNDVFLRHFLSNNTKLIVKSNVYNSYKQLKSAWVFRFSEAIKLQRPELIRRIKELSSVPDDTWKELYEKTLVEDCLRSKLFNCCMAAFKKEEYEVVLQELLNEVIELEAKDSKTASDYLTIMSYKLLSDFENLDLVEKSCLKLSISGIIDIKSDAYKKQYKTYLPLQLYQQVSSIEPKKMMTDLQVAEFNKVYDECKKILLEDEMMPARMNKTKGMKPQIMYIMWYL